MHLSFSGETIFIVNLGGKLQKRDAGQMKIFKVCSVKREPLITEYSLLIRNVKG
jgi:hypothetical protein